MVVIDVREFDALVFDLDGVVARTATAHARAWKQLFDEYLAMRAAERARRSPHSTSSETTGVTWTASLGRRARAAFSPRAASICPAAGPPTT